MINTISQLTQLYEDQTIQKIILIPGGGNLANFVRTLYSEFQIQNEFAHWIAIFAMNFNGLELKKKFPHLEIIEDFKNLKKKDRVFSVFLPYRYFKINDPLPHSWDVTSDSITIHLAHKLGLNECFLIKDIDGILNKDNQLIKLLTTEVYKKLKEEGNLTRNLPNLDLKEQSKPIDVYLTTLIEEHKINCIIINGKSSKLRIYKYFSQIEKTNEIFTKIYSE